MTIGKDTYPFSEFRGLGSPGLNIGQPGDIYIDITPGLHALYARYPESWILWPGANDASNLLRHPLHSDRCLWCHTKVGWIHPRYVRVNPGEWHFWRRNLSICLNIYVLPPANASELLSEIMKCQEKLSEESKKRKRETLHQPIRTELPFTTSTYSPSQNRNLVEKQSPTDALPLLSSTIPYSQPAHEITISRTPLTPLTPTGTSIVQRTWSRLIFWIFRNLFYTLFSQTLLNRF